MNALNLLQIGLLLTTATGPLVYLVMRIIEARQSRSQIPAAALKACRTDFGSSGTPASNSVWDNGARASI